MIIFFKTYIKSIIFILIAYITKNIPNHFELKSIINYYFYYKKCKKIFKYEKKKFEIKYPNLSDVLNNAGYACINTEKSKKTAKSILDKMKVNILEHFDHNGNFIKGCLIKNFPELKDFIKSELDHMFKSVLKSNYKIYDMKAYYSKHKNLPETGSELPHTDSEPAPTFKCQFNLTNVNQDNAMTLIRWDNSLSILFKMIRRFFISKLKKKITDRISIRNEKVNILKDIFLKNRILTFKPDSQESGLLYFFNNNTLHWGGHLKEKNNERIVITFRVHCDHKDNLNDFFLDTDKFTTKDKHYFKIPEEFKIFQNF